MPLFYFYLFICLFFIFSFISFVLAGMEALQGYESRLERRDIRDLSSLAFREWDFFHYSKGFHQACVTFSLPYLAFIADCEGKQLELGLITKTGTGGREGKDGNHAASRGGLVLYK